MIRIKFLIASLLLAFTGIFLFSCTKSNSDSSSIVFTFSHTVDGQPVQFDTIKYINAAGNQYSVSNIQYFVSDFKFWKHDGTQINYTNPQDIHYVDTDIPGTFTWNFSNNIIPGDYDSITFNFGIDTLKNKPGLFSTTPEMDMSWPMMMGGGYHYMKLNGKWIPAGGTEAMPFGVHLGIGQIYNADSTINRYVQNYFVVKLDKSFTILNGQTKTFNINMNIEKWFKYPYVYNFDVYGGSIMGNQEAQNIFKKNGKFVFSESISSR